MGAGKRRAATLILAAVFLAGTVGETAVAATPSITQPEYELQIQTVTRSSSTEEAVTVTNRDQFMAALSQKKSAIIVDGVISIGDQVDSMKRTLPVEIPGDTVITATAGSSLNCRGPIQLVGDNVCFRNIQLHFESTDALGSVPHREIFLAGHSLTLDNVDTYLEGGAGGSTSIGGLGGTEEELLPTVYGGGFSGTQIGNNASLTVINANDKTMFKGIYMGHDTESDGKVPYSGDAVLNLDAKTVVRETVSTERNSQAAVCVTGVTNSFGTVTGMKAKSFSGNANTSLTLRQCSLSDGAIRGIGNILLEEKAGWTPSSDDLDIQNITVRDQAYLDLNGVSQAVITGDFTGGAYDPENQIDERGDLILNVQGSLTIQGSVSGVTRFQTDNRLFPGILYPGHRYIIAGWSKTEQNFVLAEKSIQAGYQLNYVAGAWTEGEGNSEEIQPVTVGSIEIVSAPDRINVEKISDTSDLQEAEAAGKCQIIWRDADGNRISYEEVRNREFYGFDYVIGMKTEYWESDDPDLLGRTDWSNTICFNASEDEADTYYLRAADGVRTGDYTFLFCSEGFRGDLNTVADVKALKDRIKAELRIQLYSGEAPDPTPEPNPTPTPEPDPTPTPDPAEPLEHIHNYKAQIIKEADCTEKGIKSYQCTVCGDSYTEEIPQKAHNVVQTLTKAIPGRDGSKAEKCSSCGKILRQTVIPQPKTLTLAAKSYIYNGSEKKPKVTVKDRQGNVIPAGSYTVSYQKNKNPGRAAVTVQFKGNYGGTLKKNFTITPKSTSLSRVTASSKGFTVKWKKQTTQVDGYRIQYSTSKKFSGKTTKTLTVKNKKTTTKTVKKLKAKKKYYVRICTYKNVKAGKKTVKFYSKWSKAKSVKVKK